MKRGKKILLSLLVLALWWSLSACGNRRVEYEPIDLSVYDGTWVCGDDILRLDSERGSYTISRGGRVGTGDFSQSQDTGSINFNNLLYLFDLQGDTLTLDQNGYGGSDEALGDAVFTRDDSALIPEYSLNELAGEWVNQFGDTLEINADGSGCTYQRGLAAGESTIGDRYNGLGPYIYLGNYAECYFAVSEDLNYFIVQPYEGEDIRGVYFRPGQPPEGFEEQFAQDLARQAQRDATAQIIEEQLRPGESWFCEENGSLRLCFERNGIWGIWEDRGSAAVMHAGGEAWLQEDGTLHLIDTERYNQTTIYVLTIGDGELELDAPDGVMYFSEG